MTTREELSASVQNGFYTFDKLTEGPYQITRIVDHNYQGRTYDNLFIPVRLRHSTFALVKRMRINTGLRLKSTDNILLGRQIVSPAYNMGDVENYISEKYKDKKEAKYRILQHRRGSQRRAVCGYDQRLQQPQSGHQTETSFTVSVRFPKKKDKNRSGREADARAGDISVQLSEVRRAPGIPDDLMLAQFKSMLDDMERKLGRTLEVRLSDVYAFQSAQQAGDDNPAAEGADFTELVRLILLATEKFIASKKTEGENTARVIRDYLRTMAELLETIESYAELSVERSLERLKINIEKVAGAISAQDPLLLREVAVIADKLDISEEKERLKIHFRKMNSLLDAGGQIGKELDYLCQEIFRESNTICSKTNLTEIKDPAIKIKTVNEKIREQSMNLE
ncbi:hypothetical protein CHS0354_018436 [Potamilus streckersoni]|uniref:Endoribonuclease YicC-like C-terminal domain-containing protein n=1 Tax=Potamilus streckersoni TaxID=2493646 RepID=A0AAE0WAW4_9BIVA|nr:hypothetical protein CHS0354_018436 [Potamilus streckersoni]